MIRIAMPVFHKRVSPVFDNCTRLLIIDFNKKREVSRQEVSVEEFTIAERFNLIKKMNINVIICCAISETMDQMIRTSDIQLTCGIVGNVNRVLTAYLSNRLNEASFHMPGYQENR